MPEMVKVQTVYFRLQKDTHDGWLSKVIQRVDNRMKRLKLPYTGFELVTDPSEAAKAMQNASYIMYMVTYNMRF